jgi:hypothetical protein
VSPGHCRPSKLLIAGECALTLSPSLFSIYIAHSSPLLFQGHLFVHGTEPTTGAPPPPRSPPSIRPAVPPRRCLLHAEYHTEVKSPIPRFFPRFPHRLRHSALAGVGRPPPAVEALIRHPSHLPVALVGFAVFLALRRARPHPKPWPLDRERISGEVSGRPPHTVVCPPPACDQGHLMGTDGPDLKGGETLRSVHRGPVDRVRRRRSTSLRHARVSSASAQPIVVGHVAHPQPLRRLPWQFCKKDLQFPEFTTMPFHL